MSIYYKPDVTMQYCIEFQWLSLFLSQHAYSETSHCKYPIDVNACSEHDFLVQYIMHCENTSEM